ncbi:MAG TPA: hypothetical protein PLS76_05515 [Acinetobacter sp.]|nr:hypothetical protein [Acinetobacter sp.]HQZ59797.1 hypothetical protein [Acinetobacter sp.]
MRVLRFLIFFTSSTFFNYSFAANDYDIAFKESGALNTSHEIVNQDKYDELIDFMNDLAMKSIVKLNNEEINLKVSN